MSFLTLHIRDITCSYMSPCIFARFRQHRRLTVGPWGESIRGSVETKGATSCWAVVWNLSMPHPVNVLRCPKILKIWQARGTPIVSIAKALSSILETWHILKRSINSSDLPICHGFKVAVVSKWWFFPTVRPFFPLRICRLWHCMAL